MPRDELQALTADVRRLLAAGGTAAVGDDGLRRRGQALRELGRKVPALASIADAVERVLGAGPTAATPALLDLLLVARQVGASLAGTDGTGPAQPPAGLKPQVLSQHPPRVLVRGQRVGLTAGAIEREHELPVETLAYGVTSAERFELRDESVMLAEREVGVDPILAYTCQVQVHDQTNDWEVAGGLRGEPIELVKCKTCDIEVPATAEVVIEFEVDMAKTVMEGPLGEYTAERLAATIIFRGPPSIEPT